MDAASLPIIVTRAEPGASETGARLRVMGLTPVLAPMLTLVPREHEPLPNLENISGLVFTSANGVRVFAGRSQARELPAWCVGPATAAAARTEGFSQVHESTGNALDLARYISANTQIDDRPLLHIANRAAAGTLKSELEAAGFRVIFAPLYEMRPAKALPSAVDQMLAGNQTAILLIHSQKGASAFAALMPPRSGSSLLVIAISDLACEPLKVLPLRSIHIAEAPNEDGLFSALHAGIATLSA